MNDTIRKVAASGRFYHENSSSLITLMDQILQVEKDEIGFSVTLNF
jgi:hypothetical protein